LPSPTIFASAQRSKKATKYVIMARLYGALLVPCCFRVVFTGGAVVLSAALWRLPLKMPL